jgi:hypothetical protein
VICPSRSVPPAADRWCLPTRFPAVVTRYVSITFLCHRSAPPLTAAAPAFSCPAGRLKVYAIDLIAHSRDCTCACLQRRPALPHALTRVTLSRASLSTVLTGPACGACVAAVCLAVSSTRVLLCLWLWRQSFVQSSLPACASAPVCICAMHQGVSKSWCGSCLPQLQCTIRAYALFTLLMYSALASISCTAMAFSSASRDCCGQHCTACTERRLKWLLMMRL